jgi:hypothetical protein
MARLISNPPKPVVRIKINVKNFKKVLSLAQSVHTYMVLNVGTFVTPPLTMVNFNNDIVALQAAIAALGTKSNKGGFNALAACSNASEVVFEDLVTLSNYVTSLIQSLTPALAKVYISLSGFASKSPHSKVDSLQFVRNVKQYNTKKYPLTSGLIKWKKSLGLFKGVKIAGYNVYVNGIFHSSATKTICILDPVLVPTISQVTIKPFNAQGEGNGQTFAVTQIPALI